MGNGYLTRFSSSEQGTKGSLIIPSFGFSCCVMELPWEDNLPKYSCVSPGIYGCTIRKSPHFGNVYWVMEVDGRSWILMHNGNFAGDFRKGWETHSEGCIIVGKYFGKLRGQDAVLYSRPILRQLIDVGAGRPFDLHISNLNQGRVM